MWVFAPSGQANCHTIPRYKYRYISLSVSMTSLPPLQYHIHWLCLHLGFVGLFQYVTSSQFNFQDHPSSAKTDCRPASFSSNSPNNPNYSSSPDYISVSSTRLVSPNESADNNPNSPNSPDDPIRPDSDELAHLTNLTDLKKFDFPALSPPSSPTSEGSRGRLREANRFSNTKRPGSTGPHRRSASVVLNSPNSPNNLNNPNNPSYRRAKLNKNFNHDIPNKGSGRFRSRTIASPSKSSTFLRSRTSSVSHLSKISTIGNSPISPNKFIDRDVKIYCKKSINYILESSDSPARVIENERASDDHTSDGPDSLDSPDSPDVPGNLDRTNGESDPLLQAGQEDELIEVGLGIKLRTLKTLSWFYLSSGSSFCYSLSNHMFIVCNPTMLMCICA